jgi:hypothetical protein
MSKKQKTLVNFAGSRHSKSMQSHVSAKKEINKLSIDKIIYPSRGKHTKNVDEILTHEINHHLSLYPDVEFDGISSKKQNADLTTTFTLKFKYKKNG